MVLTYWKIFSQNIYHKLLSTCEYCKVFKNSFFIEHLQKQSFADVLQNSCSKKFCKLHRKALVLQSLFKKLAAEGLQFIKKRHQHRCFSVKFAKFLRPPLFIEHLRWLLQQLWCLLLYFFLKNDYTIKQLFRNLVMMY